MQTTKADPLPRCRPPLDADPQDRAPQPDPPPMDADPPRQISWMQTPPHATSTSGRYESYWNAYLFLHKFTALWWSGFSNAPLENRIQLRALLSLQGVELWYTISITRKGGGSADYCHNQLRNKLIAVAITLGVILVLLYIALIVLYFSKWRRLVSFCFTW